MDWIASSPPLRVSAELMVFGPDSVMKDLSMEKEPEKAVSRQGAKTPRNSQDILDRI